MRVGYKAECIYRMLKLDDFNKINLLCSVAKLVFDVYISVISAAA